MSGNDVQATVLEIIARVAGADAAGLGPATKLVSQLGIDSPRALQMLVELEERLDIEIADEDIAELHTVGDVLKLIERSAGGA